MRRLFQLGLLLFVTLPAWGQAPTITPLNPAVNQGATQAFTCATNCGGGGTWSCSGCAGSINSGSGVYTAPATVTNQQTAGGMQLLANNHIFNVDISGLSASAISGGGSTGLSYYPGFPVNYATGATPTVSMLFYYSTNNNGSFQIPAYPLVKIENGWLNARNYNPGSGTYCEFPDIDHHLLVMDTTDGTMQEMYQYYPPGCNGDFSTTNSQSGQRYSNSSYALPAQGAGGGSTDAAGLDLWPLVIRLQEVEQAVASGGTINHAARMTISSGNFASNFIWPGSQYAPNGGTRNYAERWRLKSSVSTAGICGSEPICIVLITQLKKYGVFLADGGIGTQVIIEDTRWPQAYANALNVIQSASITPSSFELVDESSLEISSTSGEANTGRETVTFTRTSDSATASTDVIDRGVAVTLPQDIYNIWPGTPAQQLTAFVNIGSVTWTMSPTVGTLTSGGLYTPPSTSSTMQTTTVTATSATNGAVAAQMTLNVYPVVSNVTYLKGCATTDAPCTSNYTDAGSHVWIVGEHGAGDADTNFGTLQAYGYNNGGSWSGTDITLYEIPFYSGGDMRFDVVVPNGNYSVVGKFARNSTDPNQTMIPELNGVQYNSGTAINIYSLAGGANKPYDITQTATVSDNHLAFVIRAAYVTESEKAFLGAFSITQTGGGGGGGGGGAGAGMMK